MKSFLERVTDNQKEYKFTVKIACSDVTDKMLDCLENCLAKYDLISAGKFKKTPLLTHPIDFPRVKNSEVHVTEIVTRYPATRDMLEVELAEMLDLHRNHVVVYSEKDPRAISSILTDPEEVYNAKVGTEIHPDEEADATEYRSDNQRDNAMDDAYDRKQNRKVTIVHNDMSPEQAFDSAEFKKQEADTEVKKSVFFGREK